MSRININSGLFVSQIKKKTLDNMKKPKISGLRFHSCSPNQIKEFFASAENRTRVNCLHFGNQSAALFNFFLRHRAILN